MPLKKGGNTSSNHSFHGTFVRFRGVSSTIPLFLAQFDLLALHFHVRRVRYLLPATHKEIIRLKSWSNNILSGQMMIFHQIWIFLKIWKSGGPISLPKLPPCWGARLCDIAIISPNDFHIYQGSWCHCWGREFTTTDGNAHAQYVKRMDF